MENSKESQNTVHLVKSPLNFFKISFGGLTLVVQTWGPLNKSSSGCEVGEEEDLLNESLRACGLIVTGSPSSVVVGMADLSQFSEGVCVCGAGIMESVLDIAKGTFSLNTSACPIFSYTSSSVTRSSISSSNVVKASSFSWRVNLCNAYILNPLTPGSRPELMTSSTWFVIRVEDALCLPHTLFFLASPSNMLQLKSVFSGTTFCM